MADFVDLLDPLYISAFGQRQAGPVDAVPTPLPTWNSMSGGDGGGEGLARKWLVTIGGNPKQGKTILSLNVAERALRHGEKVGFMSLEMSDPELASRFYAMLGKVPIAKVQKGKLFDASALEKAKEAASRYGYENGVPQLFVNDEPIFDLSFLLEHMHSLNEEARVRFYIVDYLQLVSMEDDEQAVRVITKAVKELRRFAKVTNSTVVLLSQFKRTVSEDYTQSPMPQGLFGGGAIEQVSDQILLLDHSLYEYDRAKNTARTWLKLTNRHGQHGDIPLFWDYNNLTVTEGMEHEEDAWPTRKRVRR